MWEKIIAAIAMPLLGYLEKLIKRIVVYTASKTASFLKKLGLKKKAKTIEQASEAMKFGGKKDKLKGNDKNEDFFNDLNGK